LSFPNAPVGNQVALQLKCEPKVKAPHPSAEKHRRRLPPMEGFKNKERADLNL
jgi:hypothetical protein